MRGAIIDVIDVRLDGVRGVCGVGGGGSTGERATFVGCDVAVQREGSVFVAGASITHLLAVSS